MGGGIRNPTITQFLSNERKIAVPQDLNVRASNVQGKKRPMKIVSSKLDKRKKK